MSTGLVHTSLVVLLALAASRLAAGQPYPSTNPSPPSPPGPNSAPARGEAVRRLPPSTPMPTDPAGTAATLFEPATGNARLSWFDVTPPPQGVPVVEYVTHGGHGETAEAAACATCPPFCRHRTSVFGAFLFLQPRDAAVAYAVPIDGAIFPPPENPIQVGPVAATEPDYAPGIRIGGSWAIEQCTSLVGTYTYFESHASHQVEAEAPLVLRSLVAHPGTLNAAADYLAAAADQNIEFQTVDLDYRSIWRLSKRNVVHWSVGARYAQLNQDFDARFGETGTTDDVLTAVDFDGAGVRLGLDAERHHCGPGIMLYGRGALSFVAGRFRSSYFQGSDMDPQIVDTTFSSDRVVPILDVEVGAGWQSSCGRFRVTAGYVLNLWFNTLTSDSWIRSVQQNSFVGQADAVSWDTLTFDGLTARVEYRF